jgi:hypothetical protein
MWVTDDGVFHTVALPDPTHVMASQWRVSFDALIASQSVSTICPNPAALRDLGALPDDLWLGIYAGPMT